MDRDLSNFRPSRIWRRLPLDRRIDAAGLFWDDEQAADQQLEAVSSIATHMKFRPRSVLSLGPEKRAKYLAQLPTILHQPKTDPASQVIYLRADERVPFGAFASVMDAVKQAGITNISIVTQPLQKTAK